jgi:hypothetical protein
MRASDGVPDRAALIEEQQSRRYCCSREKQKRTGHRWIRPLLVLSGSDARAAQRSNGAWRSETYARSSGVLGAGRSRFYASKGDLWLRAHSFVSPSEGARGQHGVDSNSRDARRQSLVGGRTAGRETASVL